MEPSGNGILCEPGFAMSYDAILCQQATMRYSIITTDVFQCGMIIVSRNVLIVGTDER